MPASRHSDHALPLPGTLFAGRYRIKRLLGVGGMGNVLLAKHEALGNLVALKVLHPEAASNPSAVDRFLKEARAAAAIHGEHVVRIYDVGETDEGRPYICMEYLRGQDLGQVFDAHGPLPYYDVCTALLDAMIALSQAHAAGIVHRDLKPSNLFFAEQPVGKPVLKVLDFGIAKMEESLTSIHATSTGTIMGTPAYMAPEQMRSSKLVDARADIWALGAIAYELVSGRLPFEGESLGDILVAVMEGPPPPVHELAPSVPIELSAVIHRCLQRDPNHRFATVNDLAEAIEPFATASRAGSATDLRRARISDEMVAPLDLDSARTEQTYSRSSELKTLSVWSTEGNLSVKRGARIAVGMGVVAVGVAAVVAGRAAWQGHVASATRDVTDSGAAAASNDVAMSATDGVTSSAVGVEDAAAATVAADTVTTAPAPEARAPETAASAPKGSTSLPRSPVGRPPATRGAAGGRDARKPGQGTADDESFGLATRTDWAAVDAGRARP